MTASHSPALRRHLLALSTAALLACTGGCRSAAIAAKDTAMADLKTFSVMGKGSDALDQHREAELLRHEGAGCLTHMWFGGNWPHFQKTRLRVFVDGETTPSIDMELGLGHGIGFDDKTAPWGGERLGTTSHPGGLYNTIRIPFGRSIRVTAQRPPEAPAKSPFWWIIRGTENLPVALGGVTLPATARLKLYKLENHTAKALEEFNLCDVQGAGALYQVTMAAKGLSKTGGWHDLSFMEACMRGYFDGARDPTLLSSGLEDYFTGTYYFNRGRFGTNLAGLTHLDTANQEFSAYRLHEDDPIFFAKGFRLTCRCGETWAGTKEGKAHGNPPATQYTTYTWLYQW